MKRINEATGSPFQKGDIRDDGRVFFTYCKSVIKKDGFFKEKWLSPEAAKKQKKSQVESIAAWQAARHIERRSYINEIKLRSGCVDCGYKAHPSALDFDHLDPAVKEFNISSRYLCMEQSRLDAEISKCVVRCANCHRIKSIENEDHKIGRA